MRVARQDRQSKRKGWNKDTIATGTGKQLKKGEIERKNLLSMDQMNKEADKAAGGGM